MKQFINRKETLLILFYATCLTCILTVDTIAPNHSAHAPGLSFFLFILLIPISIIYLYFHIYRYYNRSKSYSKCLWIHFITWLCIILYIKYI